MTEIGYVLQAASSSTCPQLAPMSRSRSSSSYQGTINPSALAIRVPPFSLNSPEALFSSHIGYQTTYEGSTPERLYNQ